MSANLTNVILRDFNKDIRKQTKQENNIEKIEGQEQHWVDHGNQRGH